MKNASAPLKTLLATGRFEKADVYTVTLKGGIIVRWTDADRQITYGNPFLLGPIIKRGTISDKMGLETSTLDLTLSARDDTVVNSVPLIQFIKGRGLDGANIKLERVFMPTWEDPVTGGVIRFAGRVTSVGEIAGVSAKLTVSSWAHLLNVNYPPNVYQAGCMHTVYDAGCGLAEATFQTSFTCTTGSTTSLVKATAGGSGTVFDQGRIKFTSGANNGLSRTIKSQASGNFDIIPPLPVAPAAGDTFLASQGCDLTTGTCTTRFNNLLRFKGTPYVPVPETAI
jgi:uncharacterized phage protein (TIGR02218 family)